jgi:predicted permease
MPVSAYVQSAIFLILAAVALFAAAGTIAILGFWLYLAILAAIIVASLLSLDPGLLRERMRPGGQRPPLALRLFTIVMFLHWIVAGLDRGRFHWSDGAFRHGYRPST